MSTNVMPLDLNSAEGYNITKGPDGVWRTREGLTIVASLVNLYYGFTLLSPSGQTYHYLFGNSNAVGDPDVDSYIYDEEWVLIASVDAVTTLIDLQATWTHADNYGQFIVNSPGLSRPLWGFVGSTPVVAERVDSLIPDTPAIDLLPGYIASFADRFVWVFNNQIYINDPGTEPKTITASNAIGFSGVVTDCFQAGSGGELIVVTTDGVYTLPPDGLSGFEYQSQISRSTHYRSINPRNAGTARGQIHGLCAEGIVDLRTGAIVNLTVNRRPRKITRPFGPGRSGDFRSGQMFATETGYCISFGENQSFCIVDLDSNSVSWWNTEDYSGIQGMCRDPSGRPIFLMGAQVAMYLWGDNFTDTAGLALEIAVPGAGSYVVREIVVTALGDGVTTVGAAVRAVERTAIPPAPPSSMLTDVAVWDTGTLQETEFRSRRMQFAERTDGIYCEISLGRDQKLQGASMKTVTQSPMRPTN